MTLRTLAIVFLPLQVFGQLRFVADPVKLDGGEVRFEPNPRSEPLSSTAELEGRPYHSTVDGKYFVYPNWSLNTTDENYGICNYTVIVVSRSPLPASKPIRFTLQASPTGEFLDQEMAVRFHITDKPVGSDSAPSSDQISLPLHAIGNRPFLELADSKPQDVFLFDESEVSLKLKNTLSKLRVFLTAPPDVSLVSLGKPLWDEPMREKLAAGQLAAQETLRVATVGLRPSLRRFLSQLLIPLKAGESHDVAVFRIEYQSDFSGQKRHKDYAVSIRIIAPLYALLLVAMMGSAIGSLVGTRLPSTPSGRTTRLYAFTTGALLSLIAELLGVLTVWGTSKFVLFGLDLDPQQALPAFVLGVLVGLYGFRSADKFGEVLGIKLPKAD